MGRSRTDEAYGEQLEMEAGIVKRDHHPLIARFHKPT
jgi:hypothetical protein